MDAKSTFTTDNERDSGIIRTSHRWYDFFNFSWVFQSYNLANINSPVTIMHTDANADINENSKSFVANKNTFRNVDRKYNNFEYRK